MKKLWNEFREFAFKGSVLDLAVGVVIGGAFTAIVNSLVADIFMPLIGMLTGGVQLAGLSVKVGDAVLTYGNFIQSVVQFLLIALCLFLFVKSINRARKLAEHKAEEAPKPAPEPTKEEALLTEIRDLLKAQNTRG